MRSGVVLLGSYPQVALYRLVDVALACQHGFDGLPGSELDLIENGQVPGVGRRQDERPSARLRGQFEREDLPYPTEKPVEVSRVLISQSTQPGELVIDPFLGSGSVGVAALRLGRSFAGADVCVEAISVASARFGEAGASVTEWSPIAPAQASLLGVG